MGRTLIVFAGKYDESSAGAKRVRQFALGLRDAGDDAAVIGYYRGMGATEGAIRWDVDQWGVPHTGVGIAKGPVRNLCVAKDVLTLSSRMAELAVRVSCELAFDRILLYGTRWYFMRTVIRRLSELRLPMVADFNEWMSLKARPSIMGFDQELFRRVCIPKLAGIVGISPFWEIYARRVSKPFLLVPAMSDDEFSEFIPDTVNDFNLVYVGALYGRDLPDTMLAGVRLAIKCGAQFKFHILGHLGLFPEAIKCLERIEADPVLRDRVKVHGRVSRDHLRRIYAEAGSFLLLRGNDWDSLASFPTRLPEFLSTGVPVITSNTENLASYLKHRENTWLLPAGHAPDELADAICHLTSHRDERLNIGRGGKERARERFYFADYGRLLKQFLDELQVV
jgi:glycosyltransferase involved in cell wall biosynthesis